MTGFNVLCSHSKDNPAQLKKYVKAALEIHQESAPLLSVLLQSENPYQFCDIIRPISKHQASIIDFACKEMTECKYIDNLNFWMAEWLDK